MHAMEMASESAVFASLTSVATARTISMVSVGGAANSVGATAVVAAEATVDI